MTQKIAVIGSGIAGLGAAWLLRRDHDVTLLEANDYVGGHTHTIRVATQDGEIDVDTGFMVFNEANYPHLTALLRHLQVETYATNMSFSASINEGGLEYAGTNLNTLFAQRRNLLIPRFYGMLADIMRFNREAKRLLECDSGESLGAFLARLEFGEPLVENYLLPMAAAIWSCPTETMRSFPIASFARFFANHGLLDLYNRPRWRTIRGGSSRYVDRMRADLTDHIRPNCPVHGISRQHDGVLVQVGDQRTERFDQVVLACHADQTLAMLKSPSSIEQSLLQAFKYQSNDVWVHSDCSLMPKRRSVWSSWNYLRHNTQATNQPVAVTYWMNSLQDLATTKDIFVTLNPPFRPKAGTVFRRLRYEHPVFDQRAMLAQRYLNLLQGRDRLWFCGSYFGYGFHEDALRSAVSVASRLGARIPWGEDQSEIGPPLPSAETPQAVAS